jgi:hypothetical protein
MELFDYLKDLDLTLTGKYVYNITTNHKNLSINKDIFFIKVESTLKDLKDLLSKIGVFLDISDSKESSILSKEFSNQKQIEINLMTKDNYVRLFFPFQNNITDDQNNIIDDPRRTALNNKLKDYSYIAFFNDKELDTEQSNIIRLSLATISGTNRNRVVSTI